jgi:phenylalanyl-tRNA synthetase beta chain
MLPGMLDTIKRNLSYGAKDMKFFEIGRVYSLGETKQKIGNFVEKQVLSLGLSGKADPVSFDREELEFDIFDLKSEIGRVLGHLNLDSWDLISYDNTKEYEQSLKLILNGVEVGVLGRVASNVLEKFAVEQDTYFAELELSKIFAARKPNIRFQPLPKFPFASIDLAFFVNNEIEVGNLVESLRRVAGSMLKDISVFDIYSGKGVPDGKKSVALRISLGSNERTLNDSDIAQFIQSAEQRLNKEFSAILRKQLDDDRSQETAEKS